MRDLKLAFRTLFRAPFLTLVAIVSLALGIGANTGIFSLFNRLLLRPVAAHQPERLVNLAAPPPKPGGTSCNQAGDCEEVFSYPMFRDLESAQQVFTGIAAHRIFDANLAFRGQTLNGDGVMVSGSYFPVLGLQPAAGRLIGPGDEPALGEATVAVLSHRYWQTRFAGDPAVIGEPLIVNGHPLTIVGVAPPDFDGTTLGAFPEVFVPLTMGPTLLPRFMSFDDRRSYFLYLFARLKPGVTIEQARAGIALPYRAIINDVEAPLQKGMSDQTLARFREKPILVKPGGHGQWDGTSEARPPLLLLLGVTGLALLTACANVANLLLARATARTGEMAIRLSLGASRRQLVRQLLIESCVLAVLGGAAGLVVAGWTLDLVTSLLPAEPAELMQSVGLDGTVLLFATALTLGTGLVFGLFPAVHATRPDLVSALKDQAGQPSGARSASRFRSSLATAQIALSMALLVLAGLFTKSLFNVSRVDLGLDPERVVMFGVSPALNGYTPERSQQLFERLTAELAAYPGAAGVTASLVPLLSGSNWGRSVRVEGFEAGPDTDTGSRYNEVGPAYFQTLDIPVLAGREFTASDGGESPKVAVVNETFARKFNLAPNPVGKGMGSGGPNTELDMEIVGFVQDAKYSEVKDEIPPLFFVPYRQSGRIGELNFYVRTVGDPTPVVGAIARIVAQVDPNLPVERLQTLEQQITENVFLDRLISVLSAAFAGLATLLAGIGLYGVLAYTVAQRTREIGLRMALGAEPSRVRAMVLRQVGLMTAIGGSVGLIAAVWAGRLAGSLLYELEGFDPAVLTAAAAGLTLVALGAGLLPALRAARVDPMQALRYE